MAYRGGKLNSLYKGVAEVADYDHIISKLMMIFNYTCAQEIKAKYYRPLVICSKPVSLNLQR